MSNLPAPVALSNVALIGSLRIQLVPHTNGIDLFLRARDGRFWSPKPENVRDACRLLSVVPSGDEIVTGGMFAGVLVTREAVEAGNEVAALMLAAVDASLAAALAGAVVLTSEAAEA